MLSTTRRVAVHVRRKAAESRRLIFEFDRVAKLVHYTNVQYIRDMEYGIWNMERSDIRQVGKMKKM